MRFFPEKARRCVLLAAFIACAAAGGVARAGDDDDLVTEDAAASGQNDNMLPRAALPNDNANIDELVFGNSNGGEDQHRRNLQAILAGKVLNLARSAGLTELQQQRLSLAGRGDIQRFFECVDAIKTEKTGVLTVDIWNHLFRETEPLKASLRSDLFAGQSLFAKTLNRMLTGEQLARCQRMDRERALFQHRAGVHMTVLRLSTAMGLSDEQWQRFEEVLLKETHPARVLRPLNPSIYFNIVFVQIAQIPPKKLMPLFEPWQWRTLQRKLVDHQRFGARFAELGVILDPDDNPRGQAAVH
jgi:hypothetical protein